MQGMRILVVEDEYSVAADVAGYFHSLGAQVLGPFPSLKRAKPFIQQAQGAILDINLKGETVFPLADALAARGVPIVFFSGDRKAAIPERFKYVPSLSKPANWREAVELLVGGDSQEDDRSISDLLPKLRLAARLHVKNSEAADRLVERVLRAALDDIALNEKVDSPAKWLNRMMEKVLTAEGRDVLN